VDCTATGLVCEAGACVAPPPPPSEQLQAIRDAAAACGFGSCAANLEVNGAIVTYVRPAIGDEGAGFYLQADQAGPALLVDVDPATLGTSVAVGDRVSLVVGWVSSWQGASSALSISGLSHEARGLDVVPLVQDLSAAADVVSAVGAYADELVTVQGTLSGTAAPWDTGFVAFGLETAGYPSGDANLRLRIEESLPDALDLVAGCGLRLGPAPLNRYAARAEPTIRSAAEITGLAGCPAPHVVSAAAWSATEVRITFDRRLDPASVVPDGSQVTLTGGLAATAAAVSGRVLVVTTSAQTPGASYTATVAGTLLDSIGTAVEAGARSASFDGYVVPAVLSLEEAAPRINSARHLVELLVTSGGSLAGSQLRELGATRKVIFTFPDLTVATGDLVVVHFVPLLLPDGNAPASETTGKAQYPAASYPENYDGAWDLRQPAVWNPLSSSVLRVDDRLGRFQDGIPFVDPNAQSTGFFAELQALQGAGEWLPADCGGAPCTNLTTPRASAVSVNWTTVGNTPTANTVQRRLGAETRTNADWAVRTSTLGAANAP
jgi:hypothetical protein